MPEPAAYSKRSEVDRVFDTLSALEQDGDLQQSTGDASHPILTMTSLGRLGRFGNQLFQYAFLKICACQSGAQVECPAWIGQVLFGHSDPAITHRLPPAIEQLPDRLTLFDAIPEFIPYIEKLGQANHQRIGEASLQEGLQNVDLWGFFQFHTRLFAPHRDYIRSLFQPVEDIRTALEPGIDYLRSQGKTIVGIHLRRGDFVTLALAGFTLAIPSSWWVEWLRQHWQKWEAPILFICSDDLEVVLPSFAEFQPLTYHDLPIQLPECIQQNNAEFYLDFFVLSQCDVLGISNSIFSFSAAMLNDRAKQFIRPHWDFSTKFISFDPWNSEPLLYFGNRHPQFIKPIGDALRVTYQTQGFTGLLKTLLIYIPRHYVRKWSIKLYLRYQTYWCR